MTISTWLLYVAAVFVLTVTPGPSVLMSVSTSVQHGPRAALMAACGSTCAIALVMLMSMLGLGSVLAASETLFAIVKWLGVGYLAYLGLAALLSKSQRIDIDAGAPAAGARTLFRRGFLVGASNPKALLFFGALFPQFIEPAAPQAPQFIVLGLTFVCFEMFWLCVYALTAARARVWLSRPRRAALFNRVTGTVFLAAAGWLALARRSPSA
ncbi:MAG: LysE family translocator [Ottowia sp.]|uniref:LysE family translocator n=1 Tax=Ottowia sp. TaxID=1898956 RepID=UPI0039E6926B